MADLALAGLTKRYGEVTAVDRLDLTVGDREFLTLLGPSGSGKTTALRMIAGYIAPTSGVIRIGGEEVQTLPPERRDIGMVFQHYALFPHLSVFRNVAFGLERRRRGREEIVRRVGEALELVRLSGLDRRMPRELSGGQQQRVALARALVIRPRLLLLDEPLSNLDAKLRIEVRLEIRRLQRELGITTILVTHDQEEALTMSERIAVLAEGRLQQVGTPRELYDHPANRFVAGFIGQMNLLPVVRIGVDGGLGRYRLSGGHVVLAPAGPEEGLLAIRPEALRLAPPRGPEEIGLEATLQQRAFLGEVTEVVLQVEGGDTLTVRGTDVAEAGAAPGQRVTISWPVARGQVLSA